MGITEILYCLGIIAHGNRIATGLSWGQECS